MSDVQGEDRKTAMTVKNLDTDDDILLNRETYNFWNRRKEVKGLQQGKLGRRDFIVI
jgi:hypothetical protein